VCCGGSRLGESDATAVAVVGESDATAVVDATVVVVGESGVAGRPRDLY